MCEYCGIASIGGYRRKPVTVEKAGIEFGEPGCDTWPRNIVTTRIVGHETGFSEFGEPDVTQYALRIERYWPDREGMPFEHYVPLHYCPICGRILTCRFAVHEDVGENMGVEVVGFPDYDAQIDFCSDMKTALDRLDDDPRYVQFDDAALVGRYGIDDLEDLFDALRRHRFARYRRRGGSSSTDVFDEFGACVEACKLDPCGRGNGLREPDGLAHAQPSHEVFRELLNPRKGDGNE